MQNKNNRELYKITMTYGLYVGLALSVVVLLFHLGGQVEIPGSISGWFNTAIVVFAMMYFGKQYQKQYYPQGIKYGKAYGFTILLSIFSSVIFTFFLYLYYAYIEPEAVTLYLKQIEITLKEALQMPNDQMEIMLGFYQQILSPGIMAFSAGFKQVISGAFIGLIASYFLKSPLNFNKTPNYN